MDGRFQDDRGAVDVGGLVVLLRLLPEEVRVHGLEAHDVVEAGLVHAQPFQRPLHVRAVRVREQLHARGEHKSILLVRSEDQMMRETERDEC